MIDAKIRMEMIKKEPKKCVICQSTKIYKWADLLEIGEKYYLCKPCYKKEYKENDQSL